VSVAAASPAFQAGLAVGDQIISIDGRVPRDVIEYHLLTDEADPEVAFRRGHDELVVEVPKPAGIPMGIEVSSALFDRVRTCDNHCDFCFIYQLPKGMRRSLYLKDDDYRLSFLYGNFTTLTRFTELDLERVIAERLSPLYVSIHSTDPELRARLVRNRRGATSLRWLRALLDAGIEVHGQIVVCPGVNDGDALEDTLAGVADQYPELATVACVPVGVSRYSPASDIRPLTASEAAGVLDLVHEWQKLFTQMLGRRLVHAADELYLLAGRGFPDAPQYEGFPQHENGIGMATAFSLAFEGDAGAAIGTRSGFFSWVDGAPAEGYRATRNPHADNSDNPDGADPDGAKAAADPAPAHRLAPDALDAVEPVDEPVVVVTGEYGAQVLRPLIAHIPGVDLLAVRNDWFGGNIAVTGLLVGTDVARALDRRRPHGRVLLPDVCLSQGRFLDGLDVGDLPVEVEVVATDGLSLRRALQGKKGKSRRPPDADAPAPANMPVSIGARR
jgi:putative radical SAM enzyme (TIGR03279 family)